MKGYKAFEKGLICRGKQYAENTVFEKETAVICESGMHFCVNPIDVLDHYPLIDGNGNLTEFAEVEALDTAETNDYKKFCTKKLKIGAKLNLSEFIKLSVKFLFEKRRTLTDKASVDYSQLATSGNGSRLATSGYGSQLATSGNHSKLVASGGGSQLATSGDNSILIASGNYSQLATSGDGSQLATSGDFSHLVTSGNGSILVSSGDYSQLATSGNRSYLATSGDGSQLATSGDFSHLVTSGYGSILVSSGGKTRIDVQGKKTAVAAIGIYNQIKGVIGTWITLAEYEVINGMYVCKCVKSAQIDGKILKADTWYTLRNGEFEEVKC